MQRELRDKWTAALRDGSHQQGRATLCYEFHDGMRAYCCIGVLCDVADPQGWRHNSVVASHIDHQWGETQLSIRGLREVGLTEEEQEELVYLNDVDKLDFPAIADWVERHI